MLELLFAPDVGNHSEVLSLLRPAGNISATPKRFVTLSIVETSNIWFQKFESSFTGFKFLKPDVAGINIHLPYECIATSLFHLINGQFFSSLSKLTCIGNNSDRVLLLIYMSFLLMFLCFIYLFNTSHVMQMKKSWCLPVASCRNSSSSEWLHAVHACLENKVVRFPPFTVLVFELTPKAFSNITINEHNFQWIGIEFFFFFSMRNS